MNIVALVILIAAGLTTIWLFYYVHFHLPAKVETRMLESMQAFSKAVELRFPNNTGKTQEVVELSRKIAKRFDYTRSELHNIELAAHLRDIGCCAIPYRLFNERNRVDWTDAEAKVFSRHPEVSGAMLELVPSLRHVANSVRYHHLRFDGADSPGSPIGTAIPLNARILKVVSDYVWALEELGERSAHRMVTDGCGTVYCPDVVAEFRQVLTSTCVQESEPSFVGL